MQDMLALGVSERPRGGGEPAAPQWHGAYSRHDHWRFASQSTSSNDASCLLTRASHSSRCHATKHAMELAGICRGFVGRRHCYWVICATLVRASASARGQRLIGRAARHCNRQQRHIRPYADICCRKCCFLSCQVDLDSRDAQRDTPLHISARGGHAGIVELLLAKCVPACVGSTNSRPQRRVGLQ